jgi:hypothetical protein
MYVGVLDVSPVLAQVDRNAGRPASFGRESGLQNAGIAGASGLPNRGYVVDVYAEMDLVHGLLAGARR